MRSNHTAIELRRVSKRYVIRHRTQTHSTLAEAALSRMRRPLRRSDHEDVWALRDVDLNIAEGEVLGLIGSNGAGKSTLLKVLAQITPPTRGEIELLGRVGSLLEVGTGFHPELTGRENVYLNGSILGMTKSEITRQFDAIVSFAGVERFLDTPVKRYSSGMYVRLAFAVAAHLTTEILLIDEVLAVGDQKFQEACLNRIRDVASSGRTVIFVSHHLPSIERLCDRTAVLERGRLTSFSSTRDGIAAYLRAIHSAANDDTVWQHTGSGEVRLVSAATSQSVYGCSEAKVITFCTRRLAPDSARYFVSAHVVDGRGDIVAQCDSRLENVWGSEDEEEFELRLEHPWLRPGQYRVDLFVCDAGILDQVVGACSFSVAMQLPYTYGATDEAIAHGQTLPCFAYRRTGGRSVSVAEHQEP